MINRIIGTGTDLLKEILENYTLEFKAATVFNTWTTIYTPTDDYYLLYLSFGFQPGYEYGYGSLLIYDTATSSYKGCLAHVSVNGDKTSKIWSGIMKLKSTYELRVSGWGDTSNGVRVDILIAR